MAFLVSLKDGVLHVAFTGSVAEADLRQVGMEVLKIEAASEVIPHRVVDLTMVAHVDLDFWSILSLARQRMEMTIGNPIKSAIVASQPAHVGFARMFQTVNRHPSITVRIFPDAPSALAWLAGG